MNSKQAKQILETIDTLFGQIADDSIVDDASVQDKFGELFDNEAFVLLLRKYIHKVDGIAVTVERHYHNNTVVQRPNINPPYRIWSSTGTLTSKDDIVYALAEGTGKYID